jgi:hypothetical protein
VTAKQTAEGAQRSRNDTIRAAGIGRIVDHRDALAFGEGGVAAAAAVKLDLAALLRGEVHDRRVGRPLDVVVALAAVAPLHLFLLGPPRLADLDHARCPGRAGRGQTARISRPLAAAHHPSDGEVLALIEEERKALRAERRRAGRDVLLRAAMNHFGLSRKVVLEIWNSAPRDRKGGRPKKARPGTDRPIVKRVR